jgi:hypothetical protein
MIERPWHTKAREMRAEGASYRTIGLACGVSRSTAARLLDRNFAKRQDVARYQRLLRRLNNDPAYRDAYRAEQKRRYKVRRIRVYARQEAAETGKPVAEIYDAWGVA